MFLDALAPRGQYLDDAKQRAFSYLNRPRPDIARALRSLLSDLARHPQLSEQAQLWSGPKLVGEVMTVEEARHFIESVR